MVGEERKRSCGGIREGMVQERESESTRFSHGMKIFLQTPQELGKGEGPEKTPSWVEKSKHPRHR